MLKEARSAFLYPAYAIALGDTTVLTPTLINEAHVGFLHIDQLIQNQDGNTLGIPAQYGINGVPQIAGNGGLSPISLSGLTGLGASVYSPIISKIYSIEGADGVTWVHGSSNYKFGVQVDDLTSNITQPPYGRGQFNFTGQFTDIRIYSTQALRRLFGRLGINSATICR